jgi:hypothetical protein
MAVSTPMCIVLDAIVLKTRALRTPGEMGGLVGLSRLAHVPSVKYLPPGTRGAAAFRK